MKLEFSTPFKKHLAFTFLSALAFGLFVGVSKGFERGVFWFFFSIVINMMTWILNGNSIEDEDKS